MYVTIYNKRLTPHLRANINNLDDTDLDYHFILCFPLLHNGTLKASTQHLRCRLQRKHFTLRVGPTLLLYLQFTDSEGPCHLSGVHNALPMSNSVRKSGSIRMKPSHCFRYTTSVS